MAPKTVQELTTSTATAAKLPVKQAAGEFKMRRAKLQRQFKALAEATVTGTASELALTSVHSVLCT